MNLDETQKQTVTRWIHEGLKLSEIQSRMATEMGQRLTYMEVRFLVDDLKLTPKDVEPPPPSPTLSKGAPAVNAAPAEPAAEPADEDFGAEDEPLPAGGAGQVSVTVDKLAVPGAVVSGSVTFSDGKKAQWYLDEMGRLGIAAKEKGYRPSPADVQAFQGQLQRELAKMGF